LTNKGNNGRHSKAKIEGGQGRIGIKLVSQIIYSSREERRESNVKFKATNPREGIQTDWP
jgi:hypothetical protein